MAFSATVAALGLAGNTVPGLRSLMLWTALLRLVGVLGEPLLEDDFYRYLWDGYRLVEHGTPYGLAPEAFFDDPSVPPKMRAVLDGINYPELPTIYAPVQQALFGLSYAIAPGAVWPLQALLSAIDTALVALLWHLGARQGAWLYGLSPLVVKEVAFTAHPDGAGAALLMLAIWARSRSHPAAAAVASGLAAACKALAWPLVPFILWRLRPRWWIMAAGVAAATYVPFAAQATDFFSLSVFAQQWTFNSLLFAVTGSRALSGLLYVLIWSLLLYWHHRRPPDREAPRGELVLGALLLLSPVVNAWYLLWVLPFGTLRPSVTVWCASVLLLLSYWHPPGVYALPAWVWWIEIGGLGLALAVDRMLAVRRVARCAMGRQCDARRRWRWRRCAAAEVSRASS